MVSAATLARARHLVSALPDPELPMLTIEDLGMLRDIVAAGDVLEVVITPTYSGCPATDTIRADIELALADAGIAPVRVRTTLSPAWSSDWLTPAARRKLHEAGIAPPPEGAARAKLLSAAQVSCPRCGSSDTECLSAFGSTACKALWRCRSCREPFDHFKCH